MIGDDDEPLLDFDALVLPSDDEYIGYKEAYKAGKIWFSTKWDGQEHVIHHLVTSTNYDMEQREHFINGWLYQQWLETCN